MMIMACNKEKTFLRARNWYLNAGNRLVGHIFVSFDDKTKKKFLKNLVQEKKLCHRNLFI